MSEPLKVITAKVPHVCSICGKRIEPGANYTRRWRWRPKGRGYHIKKCLECYNPEGAK